jgi:hypothetical protein
MGVPSAVSTRADVSVRSPPLVPRSEMPNAAAWKGPSSMLTSGSSPPEKKRS